MTWAYIGCVWCVYFYLFSFSYIITYVVLNTTRAMKCLNSHSRLLVFKDLSDNKYIQMIEKSNHFNYEQLDNEMSNWKRDNFISYLFICVSVCTKRILFHKEKNEKGFVWQLASCNKSLIKSLILSYTSITQPIL